MCILAEGAEGTRGFLVCRTEMFLGLGKGVLGYSQMRAEYTPAESSC